MSTPSERRLRFDLEEVIARMLLAHLFALAIHDLDLVDETTRVDVRFQVGAPERAGRRPLLAARAKVS